MLIDRYLREMEQIHRSPNTIRLRRAQLRQWRRHVGDVTTATKADVLSFLAPLPKPATRASALSAVRGFYKWALDEGLVEKDPTVRVEVRRPRAVPKPIPDADLVRVLGECDEMTRRIFVLARFAGLRACEIARVHSADLSGGYLWVDGKGGTRLPVPAHPEVVRLVSSVSGWLFPSARHPGEPWRAGSVSQRADDFLRERTPGFTLHSLRHRFVTCAYKDSGGDLLVAQQLARHATVATTQGYAKVEDDRAALVVAGMRLAG